LIKGKALLPPFVALSGMGESHAKSVCEARQKGAFSSVEELRQRARLQRNVIDLLLRAGCLYELVEHNQMLLY
jgi:DNA polymerase-3 subunit alpha (Gram-positive type)